jgi:phage terminase large subunit GpA-like protein
MAIDSGDGHTMEAVYSFAFPRFRRKVLAIKGVTGPRPWIERSKQKTKGGFLFIVGVDGLKRHLFSQISRPGSMHFSIELGQAWFEQLASERMVTRYSRGQPQRRFERIPGRKAEALDCTVYAIAAKQLCNVNWGSRAEELARPELATAPTSPRPKVIKSAWMDS